MINKPRDQQTPVSFRSLEVEAAIKERVGPPYDSMGAVAKRDLERYYYLLRETLQTVNLSEQEAMLICDSLNGAWSDPQTIRIGLWAGVDDSIRLDGLDEKWGVDGPSAEGLVEKLRNMSYAQACAVTDAVERFWRRNEIDEDPRERLRIVGLVRREKKEEEETSRRASATA